MRLHDVLQREGAGDHRLELSSVKTVDDKALSPIQAVRLGDHGKQRVSAHHQILRKRREEREWRRLRSQRTVKKQGAAFACRRGQSLDAKTNDV